MQFIDYLGSPAIFYLIVSFGSIPHGSKFRPFQNIREVEVSILEPRQG